MLQILFRTNTYCAFAPVAAVSVVKDSWSSADEFAAAAPEDAEEEGFMAKTNLMKHEKLVGKNNNNF